MNPKFEGMFEPISESLMCGEDLSYSPEFDRIKEARREDDPTIEYGEWQTDLKQALLTLLSAPDIASKRWVYQQYDQQVQTQTVKVPGAADAAVLAPREMVNTSRRGQLSWAAWWVIAEGATAHLSGRI